MTYGPLNAQSSYLPTEFDLSGEEQEILYLIAERERMTASIVNLKESGQYENLELLSGQQFFSTSTGINKPRYTFRKVINFGTLPNAATKSVAHGISVNNNFIFTRIYGIATDQAAPFFIPLPYINTGAPGDSVELWADATNVNIKTTTANYIAYTITYVVLEYIKG